MTTPTRDEIERLAERLDNRRMPMNTDFQDVLCENAADALLSLLADRDRLERERDEAREAVKTQNSIIVSGTLRLIEAEKIMPCGHPKAAQLTSAESGDVHCSLCDMNAQLNDALKMEQEYKSERDSALARVAELERERDKALERNKDLQRMIIGMRRGEDALIGKAIVESIENDADLEAERAAARANIAKLEWDRDEARAKAVSIDDARLAALARVAALKAVITQWTKWDATARSAGFAEAREMGGTAARIHSRYPITTAEDRAYDEGRKDAAAAIRAMQEPE